MKIFFKIVLTLSLLTAVFVSCGADDEGLTFSAGYGTVEARELGDMPGRYFAVRLDNGTLLVAMDALVPINQLQNDDRIVVSYTVLGNVVVNDDNTQSYYVRINNFDKRLSKPPIYQSEIGHYEEGGRETEATLGHDPVKIGDVWLGGRYINIYFAFMKEQWNSVKHYINLVYKDIDNEQNEEGMDKYEFTLRHNGYEDVPTVENIGRFVLSRGFVSFDITSTIYIGEDRLVQVDFIWYEYAPNILEKPVRMVKSGIFKFTNGRFEEARPASLSDGGVGAYIE